MALSHDDRLIKIERIEANPLRDQKIYPIIAEKVEKLKSSYAEGDFGTIIPVRPHPTKKGFYQQACGHHRVRAMQMEGAPLEILCRVNDLSDDEMARIMVRENMNNYGNNPEAVADSVAAICKVLIFHMFLAEDYEGFATIVAKHPNPFADSSDYNKARGKLVSSGSIGIGVLEKYFGPDANDSPLTYKQISGGLAALNATGAMEELCQAQRTRAEREVEAKLAREKRQEEEAARKAQEAAEAQKAYEAAAKARRERMAAERAEAKLLKDEAERKAAEAKLAQDKADYAKEQRRQAAITKERERLDAEAKKQAESRARTEEARARIEKSKVNQEEKHVDPWMHVKAFGMFENQGQFDMFRSTLAASPQLRALFPVEQQPDIIAAMLESLRLTDNMTAKGIKEWMTEQDTKFKAQVEASKAKREEMKRKMAEEASLTKRVDRVMEDFQANLARLSRSYSEVHELMQESATADMVLAHPYAETLRYSLENQYKTLPEIEKLFQISARRVQDADRINPEEKAIN